MMLLSTRYNIITFVGGFVLWLFVGLFVDLGCLLVWVVVCLGWLFVFGFGCFGLEWVEWFVVF